MGGFGAYIHWPYCARICPYCDFNVYRARGRDPAPLLAAIIADIAAHRERLGRRAVDSVFLGGGTPSLLSGGEIGRLLDGVDRAFGLSADVEISLEANPEDAARFGDHVRAGVNRLSLGLQALDDAALKALGRWHDAQTAIAAVDAAAKTGARVSVDLIYAREHQTPAAWARELALALALPAEHLSLYQLTIEPDTAFARAVARGRLAPPGDALSADLYDLTQTVCDAAGAPAYEVSNHARSPQARARHNLVYWTSGAWIGVGPGAHGRIALDSVRTATRAHRKPQDYIAAVDADGVGWAGQDSLDAAASAEEALLMGLRLVDGVDVAQIEAWLGARLPTAALEEAGVLTRVGDRVAVTRRGRLLTDHLVMQLLR